MKHTFTVKNQDDRSTMQVDVELGNDLSLRDDQTIKSNPPKGMAVIRYCDECGERYSIYFDSPHHKKWTCSEDCRDDRAAREHAAADGNLDEQLERGVTATGRGEI